MSPLFTVPERDEDASRKHDDIYMYIRKRATEPAEAARHAPESLKSPRCNARSRFIVLSARINIDRRSETRARAEKERDFHPRLRQLFQYPPSVIPRSLALHGDNFMRPQVYGDVL